MSGPDCEARNLREAVRRRVGTAYGRRKRAFVSLSWWCGAGRGAGSVRGAHGSASVNRYPVGAPQNQRCSGTHDDEIRSCVRAHPRISARGRFSTRCGSCAVKTWTTTLVSRFGPEKKRICPAIVFDQTSPYARAFAPKHKHGQPSKFALVCSTSMSRQDHRQALERSPADGHGRRIPSSEEAPTC